jgi:hypothetical protein
MANSEWKSAYSLLAICFIRSRITAKFFADPVAILILTGKTASVHSKAL